MVHLLIFLYLHLYLGRQTQRNVACFRLHSHTLRVESSRCQWQQHDHFCDRCGLQAVQDDKHALFLCPCLQMCSLRLQFADLFTDLPHAHKIYINQTGAFSLPSLFWGCVHKFPEQNLWFFSFVLFQFLWMFFLWLVFTSRLSSQTTWLKVKPYCKSSLAKQSDWTSPHVNLNQI